VSVSACVDERVVLRCPPNHYIIVLTAEWQSANAIPGLPRCVSDYLHGAGGPDANRIHSKILINNTGDLNERNYVRQGRYVKLLPHSDALPPASECGMLHCNTWER